MAWMKASSRPSSGSVTARRWGFAPSRTVSVRRLQSVHRWLRCSSDGRTLSGWCDDRGFARAVGW
jgi:hypothetical protein